MFRMFKGFSGDWFIIPVDGTGLGCGAFIAVLLAVLMFVSVMGSAPIIPLLVGFVVIPVVAMACRKYISPLWFGVLDGIAVRKMTDAAVNAIEDYLVRVPGGQGEALISWIFLGMLMLGACFIVGFICTSEEMYVFGGFAVTICVGLMEIAYLLHSFNSFGEGFNDVIKWSVIIELGFALISQIVMIFDMKKSAGSSVSATKANPTLTPKPVSRPTTKQVSGSSSGATLKSQPPVSQMLNKTSSVTTPQMPPQTTIGQPRQQLPQSSSPTKSLQQNTATGTANHRSNPEIKPIQKRRRVTGNAKERVDGAYIVGIVIVVIAMLAGAVYYRISNTTGTSKRLAWLEHWEEHGNALYTKLFDFDGDGTDELIGLLLSDSDSKEETNMVMSFFVCGEETTRSAVHPLPDHSDADIPWGIYATEGKYYIGIPARVETVDGEELTDWFGFIDPLPDADGTWGGKSRAYKNTDQQINQYQLVERFPFDDDTTDFSIFEGSVEAVKEILKHERK